MTLCKGMESPEKETRTKINIKEESADKIIPCNKNTVYCYCDHFANSVLVELVMREATW